MINAVLLGTISALMVISVHLLLSARRWHSIAVSARRLLDVYKRDMEIEVAHIQILRTTIADAYRVAHDGDSHAACWIMYEGMRDARVAYQSAHDENPIEVDEKAAA